MQPPAMTTDEIDQCPMALVRVYCRAHGVCLYAGDRDPEGGAGAVWAAAGCPSSDAAADELAACPNRPESPPESPQTLTTPAGTPID